MSNFNFGPGPRLKFNFGPGPSLKFNFGPGPSLKWQIVCTAFCCRLLGRRERCCCCSRLLGREWCSPCVGYRSTSHGLLNLTANHIIGTYFIKPTAIILMGVYIELNSQILTILNVELLDTVFTKETEDTLAGKRARHLDDIFL